MKIEVGKKYLDRQGAEIRIIGPNTEETDHLKHRYPLVGLNADGEKMSFALNGDFDSLRSDYDLVEEVVAAVAAPAPIQSPLPTDSTERKAVPLWSGVLQYCPAALAAAAAISVKGNARHNPGGPLHHARGKSPDHPDCMARHHVDYDALLAAMRRGDSTVTPERLQEELGALLWRTGLFVQEQLEMLGLAPRAPRAVLPGEVAEEVVPK